MEMVLFCRRKVEQEKTKTRLIEEGLQQSLYELHHIEGMMRRVAHRREVNHITWGMQDLFRRRR